ncbi:MAG: sigma-70 family RNA polymerase sigma factor [Cyanothece sp. SIO1E1]|nr:sigma-70 family RNA polymerase sigma factor [Cyanothece sp. SIO1E1]
MIFNLAYNMLGSYAQAEDILQDMQLKFLEKQFPADAPKSYYARATVNHCLNILKRAERISYPGPWLPEPFTAPPDGVETKDLLHYELASLMEDLSPQERAVFVLREAMDLSHKEIAEALEISADNARQLFSRSKKKINPSPHPRTHTTVALEKAQQLLDLIMKGDPEALISLFSEDMRLIADGGGKVTTARKPVIGEAKVAKFLVNIARFAPSDLEVRPMEILSQTAIGFFQNGQCLTIWVIALDEENQRIRRIFVVGNPDKLTRVG